MDAVLELQTLLRHQRLGASARRLCHSTITDPALRAQMASLENMPTSSCSRRRIGSVPRPSSAYAAASRATLCVVSSLLKVGSLSSWYPKIAELILPRASLRHRHPERRASCATVESCSVDQGVMSACCRPSLALHAMEHPSLGMALPCLGLLPSMIMGSCLCLWQGL